MTAKCIHWSQNSSASEVSCWSEQCIKTAGEINNALSKWPVPSVKSCSRNCGSGRRSPEMAVQYQGTQYSSLAKQAKNLLGFLKAA